MLDLLGLPDKPRRRFNASDLSASASKFLLDLYKSTDGAKMKDDFNLRKEDLRTIKESDSIMTFLSKSKSWIRILNSSEKPDSIRICHFQMIE